MELIDFSNYDYDREYRYSQFMSCRHFNKLMIMITSSLNNSVIYSLESISAYINNNLNLINETNESG